MENSCLEIKNLSIGYRDKSGTNTLKDNINLSLNRGEIICLLGVNGIGKSTLLKTITGYLPALEGEVFLEGKDVNSYISKDFAKLVSLVFTSSDFPDNMTVFELVATGRIPYTNYLGKLSNHDKELVVSALKDVGMDKFHDRYCSKLSDGQRQKVMIAKSLVQQTPIIILDEPTAFLDMSARIEVLKLLSDLAHHKNIAVLMSTHDLDLALKMSDKLWLMGQGNDIFNGCPEDLIVDESINRVFDSSEVYFDTQIGSFKLIRDPKFSISLECENGDGFWLSRALLRKGYGIGNGECRFSIKIDATADLKYIIKDSNREIHVAKNIEQTLTHLSNLFLL